MANRSSSAAAGSVTGKRLEKLQSIDQVCPTRLMEDEGCPCIKVLGGCQCTGYRAGLPGGWGNISNGN